MTSADFPERPCALDTRGVGEPSPTAGSPGGQDDPPAVRQALTDGGSSDVAEAEPVEGSRRHGNAVTVGTTGTRLPAGSGPGAGGVGALGSDEGSASDGKHARGASRGHAAVQAGRAGVDASKLSARFHLLLAGSQRVPPDR